MTTAQTVRNGEGTAGNWRVYPRATLDNGELSEDYSELWHYQTRMLVWNRQTKDIYDWSTGHGSKSDQGGTNTGFHGSVCALVLLACRRRTDKLESRTFRYGASAA